MEYVRRLKSISTRIDLFSQAKDRMVNEMVVKKCNSTKMREVLKRETAISIKHHALYKTAIAK
jgi:hypothetical protein